MIESMLQVMGNLFLEDLRPWIIGYSGGKDSMTVLQLIWYALRRLPEKERLRKPVYVINTDTLMEQPVMSKWVEASLNKMKETSLSEKMPFNVQPLKPDVNDAFWTCMIGRGYAYPRNKFRWCTPRLKIWPSNAFITRTVNTYNEVILVLGTRKAESASRSANMKKYEEKRTRDYISPSGSMENQYVFSPIEDWTTDDVWEYLINNPNPWGISNNELLSLYQGGSSDDGHDILAGDVNGKSWGNSRFGCWMCTLVKKDKSLAAMINNSTEYEWLRPLLDFRNYIMENDRERRDFRRKNGSLLLFHGRLVHGPYKKTIREEILRKLLELQIEIRELAPEGYKDITLISMKELKKIRYLWLYEEHWFDDMLPKIYKDVCNSEFEDPTLSPYGAFNARDYQILMDVCKGMYPDEELLPEACAQMLAVEVLTKTTSRKGILDKFEKILSPLYKNEEEAHLYAAKLAKRREEMSEIPEDDLSDNLGL